MGGITKYAGSRSALRILLGSVAVGSTLPAIPVLAQESTPQSDDTQTSVSEPAPIIVTGSRIARRDFEANSPIVTVSSGSLGTGASATLDDKLASLPQFSASSNAYSTGPTSSGLATLNLRSLGSSRNLVLLDGRRLQPSAASMAIDINTIPSILIDGIEVISGGASAVYGSDAMSGVINFKLRQRFNGFEFKPQYSLTTRADGASYNLPALGGFSFDDGRGHVLAAFDYFHRDNLPQTNRRFYRNSIAVGGGASSTAYPSGSYNVGSTNLPSQAAINQVFSGYGVAATVNRMSEFGFNDDGTLFTGTNGIYNYRGQGASAGYGVNGTSLLYNPSQESEIVAPMKRYSGFGRIDYDVSDDIKAFAQVIYSKIDVLTNGSGPLANGQQALSVPVTNPFIPSDLNILLATRASPLANFSVNKRFSQIGRREIDHESRVYQATAGLSGRLADSLSWSIYGSHGHTKIVDDLQNGGVYLSLIQQLLNAPDGGVSLCEGGLNIFGNVPISNNCKAYISRSVSNWTVLKQDVVEGSLEGKLFDLPAGELRFAVGADYRRNSYKFSPDKAVQGASNSAIDVVSWIANYPSSGLITTKEVYAELSIPILKDIPLVESFAIDAAYRYSDYNRTGGINTYKVDGDWRVFSGLRFRAGYQRAVRAPNLSELYSAATGSQVSFGTPTGGGGDPCDIRSAYRAGANAAAARSLCLSQGVPSAIIDSYQLFNNQVGAQGAGSLTLEPEKADTFTVGAVLTSPFSTPVLRHLTFSIDYFDIKIADAIGQVGATTSLYNCFNANNANPSFSADNQFCTNIVRNTDGTPNFIRTNYQNLGSYRVSGIDMQFDWNVDLEAAGLAKGRVGLNSLISYLDRFKIQNAPGGPSYDFAGTIGQAPTVGSGTALPRWRATTTATYAIGSFDIGVRWRWIQAMRHYTAITTPLAEQRQTASYSTVDAFFGLKADEHLTFRVGLDNLTDAAPRQVGNVVGTTDAGTYDLYGRRFYLSATVAF